MSVTDAGSPYGLQRPTMQGAREAVHRVHGADGPAVWSQLLKVAGAGDHDGESAMPRLLEAMTHLDPVSRLCAQALRIRLTSHTHLAAAQTLARS